MNITPLLLLAMPMLVHFIAYFYVHKRLSSDDRTFWKNLPKANWWFVPFIAIVVFMAIFVVRPIPGKVATLALITLPSGWLNHKQYHYLKVRSRLVKIWAVSQVSAIALLLAGIYFVFFANC